MQKNIQSFGGDPGTANAALEGWTACLVKKRCVALRAGRVTLAGHSSGAFSVNFHLLSPGSRGLFAHGILEGTALETCQGLGHFFGDFLVLWMQTFEGSVAPACLGQRMVLQHQGRSIHNNRGAGRHLLLLSVSPVVTSTVLPAGGWPQILCHAGRAAWLLRRGPDPVLAGFASGQLLQLLERHLPRGPSSVVGELVSIVRGAHQELGKIKGLGKWGLAKGLAGAAWSALGFEALAPSRGRRSLTITIVHSQMLSLLPQGSFRSKGLQLGAARLIRERERETRKESARCSLIRNRRNCASKPAHI